MSDETNTDEKEPQSVLELRSVTLRDEELQNRLSGIDLSIKPGRLVVVERPTGRAKLLLASGAVGLLKPGKGEVLFQSTDWQKVSYAKKLGLRTQIGRIFDRGGWIQNLTLFDNILLGPRHHTNESDDELHKKMQALAAKFELKLVNQRPAFVQPWQLRMFQWIRALMSEPALIVAERPLTGVPQRHHQTVLQNESNFRKTGGATLWITDSPKVIEYGRKTGAEMFKAANEKLVPLPAEAT